MACSFIFLSVSFLGSHLLRHLSRIKKQRGEERPKSYFDGGVLGSDEEESILAEGAIALSVTLSGGALFAS